MREINALIVEWAKLRNLHKLGTVESQKVKTIEEFAELIIGISKSNIDLIRDSIGDIYVTLVVGNLLLKEELDLIKLCDMASKNYETVTFNLDRAKKNTQLEMTISCMREFIFIRYNPHPIVLTIMYLMAIAELYGLNFEKCVESAYSEIADRKGRVINGEFVKESDLHD